ncbi:MAG TPA: TIM-barrel domain-containing protein [Verrucomicrobiae bacterium]|nr:TIM-barrel domain-containing protein [Verrucomicrobiae bacterium]
MKAFKRFICSLLFWGLILRMQAETAVWGVNAITLRPPFSGTPSLTEVLTNGDNTVSLDQFYRAGGVGIARAATECRVACDTNNLIVVFRCVEPDLAFPATNRNDNWYSQLDAPWDQDSSFPDKVDLFICPETDKPAYFQFTVTLAGFKFGYEHGTRYLAEPGEDEGNARGPSHIPRVNAFSTTVVKGTNQWTAVIRIPWNTLGGKPRDYFGLLPVRARWRDGEVTSPVAFDFIERPPMDLFIETHFSGAKPIQDANTNLCRLPSGTLRWQRPALRTYPDKETVQAIWEMEQSLFRPTSARNFATRLWLAQRWTDLLALEGFNFRLGRGSIVTNDLSPYEIRRQVNDALQKGDTATGWRLLDRYLHQLHFASRKWFADGYPGDINQWIPISRMDGFEMEGNVLSMFCLAGDHSVNLHLSLPKTGGIRLCGDDEGYFKPDELLPLKLVPFAQSFSIATSGGNMVVSQDPFEVSFYNTAGNLVTQIGQNDLSVRFGTDGRISAVDFNNSLDANEVIFGFGERYDRFNENGNVLTLWGMDDWFGNTIGLMNETYKPIGLFHSSKGYTVFDNSTYRLRADIGKTDPQHYRLTQQGPIIDYYFWIGPPEQAIESYTDLTGKPILPPKWAFEPWMGRTGRGWNATSHNPVAEEERVTKRFATLDIPHSAIYAEGSSCESLELNQFMAARDIKVLSWFMPVISGPDQAKLLPDLRTNELPLLNAGNLRASRELGYVDFSNPNAMELFRRWWKRRLDVGVAGSMVDFGDRVPEEAVFYDGKRGDAMHNFYAYDYHRTCNQVFSAKRGKDFILFGRAAAPGDQRWVAQFAGDHPANFAGLQSVLTGALNLCACGFSTWGSDLGGFLGWPEPAVYMRWTQLACFSPLMRCHGRTPREPWDYGDAAVANYKFCAWVRENLLDYIYNAAVDANETGVPIMRSLAMAYPADLSAATNDAEYMFGRDLLIAPVVTENNNKTIAFPPGIWTDLWTGRTVQGPAIFTRNVPLDTIPIYLNSGAIIPVSLNRDLQFGLSMTGGSLKALIVTPPDTEAEASFQYDAKPLSPEPARQISGAAVKLRAMTNGFTVTLNQTETDYLLVYGAKLVKSVTVNGKRISEVTGPVTGSSEPGWKHDSTQNRVIIQLPMNHTNIEIGIAF